MKISFNDTLAKLPLPATEKWPEGVWDIEALKHGTMSLILFAPQGKDYQTPHCQDELYIVVAGAGVIEIDGESISFALGDSLFVKAGLEHRFTEMSDDLKMWAVFWGAEGGEEVSNLD